MYLATFKRLVLFTPHPVPLMGSVVHTRYLEPRLESRGRYYNAACEINYSSYSVPTYSSTRMLTRNCIAEAIIIIPGYTVHASRHALDVGIWDIKVGDVAEMRTHPDSR